ncbi:hypothetical protein L1987_50344 [Smallanthus sonchifolius]|uniref:Uncharacterized protein n=1 Tax=Smallanthus sonchifolius TaxID=185202 RepID=A0ACB9ENC8_9ASTR|nr:hypothetical protein L1987_50344 [Smallanthus sonchifolius]
MDHFSWSESLPSTRIKAIQELTKGRILTDNLSEKVGRPENIESDINSVNGLVVQISGMFENTLSILSSTNLNGILQNPTRSSSNWDYQKPKDSGESITTSVKTKKGCYKRRKNASTMIKVTSTLIDDGYAWRKYGQKVILNSKHQRNYYRCTNKFEQGCQATKQVQRTDDKPSKYKITYNGLHTCINSQIAPQIIVEAPDPKDNSILINFETKTLMDNNKVCYLSIASQETKLLYRMEHFSWPESLPNTRIKAIQELTKGRILIDNLSEMVGQPENIESDIQSVNGLVVRISGMFENTLSILSSTSLNGILHNPTSDMRSPDSWYYQKSKDSDESINITTTIMTAVKTKRGCHKRRKNASIITKMTSTLIDDGYAWRKYGQKVILNSKHQRNYYRCTHKFEQGCQATKQVQRTDDKPSKYKITYNGLHTCNNSQRAPQIFVEAPDPKDNSILISFETKTLMENNKVGTCSESMKHTTNEGFPSLDPLKHEQISSFDHHVPWDPIVGLPQVPLEPMSMMSCVLDCEDMVLSRIISSTYSAHGFQIDDMNESHDYGDLHLDCGSYIM